MAISFPSTLDILDCDNPSKHVHVRIRKETVIDGRVADVDFHRTVISPGVPVEAQMAAVNADLVQLGYEAVNADDMQSIRDEVAREHTPQVIAAFRAKLADSRR